MLKSYLPQFVKFKHSFPILKLRNFYTSSKAVLNSDIKSNLDSGMAGGTATMSDLKSHEDSLNPITCDLPDFLSNMSLEAEFNSPANESPREKYHEKLKRHKEDTDEWHAIKNKCEKVNFPEPLRFRSRPLEDPNCVFDQNAWDNIEWDDQMKQAAVEKVKNNSRSQVSSQMTEKYEDQASKYWDKFYEIHQNKFFKERNWLLNEFPELKTPNKHEENISLILNEKRRNEAFPGENSGFRVLEVGCGNGSTVFPLLEANNDPEMYVYCCDFSTSAVEVVKSNSSLNPNRCTPFVWDITSEEISAVPFPPESLQIITVIFVLSAISPEKFGQTITNLAKLLKPGGLILFRDYGLHDMAQLRFRDGRCISENFYVRGDGTRAYFFQQDEVQQLFESHGFQKRELFVDRRLQLNRFKQLKMYRIWVFGKFMKL